MRRLVLVASWTVLMVGVVLWWLSYYREDEWGFGHAQTDRDWRVRIETVMGGVGLRFEKGAADLPTNEWWFRHGAYVSGMSYPLVEGRGWMTLLGVSWDVGGHR